MIPQGVHAYALLEVGWQCGQNGVKRPTKHIVHYDSAVSALEVPLRKVCNADGYRGRVLGNVSHRGKLAGMAARASLHHRIAVDARHRVPPRGLRDGVGVEVAARREGYTFRLGGGRTGNGY